MVSLIIVSWNSGQWLRGCIESVSKQTLQPQRVLVLDNASADNSLAETQKIFPLTETVCLIENIGFAAANNLALQEISTEFVALLNPDAFPEPDWLEKLVTAAKRHPEAAAFGSRQLLYGQDDLIDGTADIYHMSGLVWRRDHGKKFIAKENRPAEIFSPCAAAALYRTEALRAIGGFDEDYFCYLEDVDLGFRLRLAGYRALYVPDAVVQHVGSATTGGQRSDFAVYHGHRNLVWTFVKNMPGPLFWLLLPLHLLLNIFSIFLLVLRGQGRTILRAKIDALGGLPLCWKKRRVVQQHRAASLREIWQVMDKRLLLWSR